MAKEIRVAYWSNSLVPSDRANAINVMHASDVMSRRFKSFELIALVPTRYLFKKRQIFKKYNVSSFELKSVAYLNIKGWSVAYFLGSLIHIVFGDKNLVITRSVFFARVAIFLNKRVFLEMHQEEWKRSLSLRLKLEKLLRSKNLLGIGVNTASLGHRFLSDFLYPTEHLLVLPNGANIDSLSKEDNDYVSSVIGTKLQGYFTVGYSGSLQTGKGAELIIEIANTTEDSSILFLILGGKAQEIESLRSEVKNDNVLFLGRHDHKYVASFLSKFDVCLLPNQSVMMTGKKSMDTGQVTSPIKLFEYMSAGKAIVASEVTVLNEILDPSFSIQVNSTNIIQWKQAILKLKSNPNLLKDMGDAARLNVLNHYSWEKRGEKLFRFIQERFQ